MDKLNRKTVEEFRQSDKIPVIVVLENIRSMYNVGSVFRTGDAFLIEAIFICGYTAQPPRKEIDKTALGATETVNWEYFTNTQEAIKRLKQKKYSIFAIEQTEYSISLRDIEKIKGGKIAIIFGNEITGVEESSILECEGCIEIPQYGMKHSLNISVAAGIVLWEFAKKCQLINQ